MENRTRSPWSSGNSRVFGARGPGFDFTIGQLFFFSFNFNRGVYFAPACLHYKNLYVIFVFVQGH